MVDKAENYDESMARQSEKPTKCESGSNPHGKQKHNYLLCLANTSDGLTQQVNGKTHMCPHPQTLPPLDFPHTHPRFSSIFLLMDDCVMWWQLQLRYATLLWHGNCVPRCHANRIAAASAAATIANCFGSKICVASSLSPRLFCF